jgi:hypothetical protein
MPAWLFEIDGVSFGFNGLRTKPEKGVQLTPLRCSVLGRNQSLN